MDFKDLPIHVVVLASFIGSVSSSVGDKSWIFQRCLGDCHTAQCSHMKAFLSRQPFAHKLLRWSCTDECKYSCMWTTVDAFHRDGSPVPQFFGKWPFLRLCGIQEPASVLFSVLNLLCHLLIFNFHRKVPSSSPLYHVWHGGAMIGINAWVWSIVFHTRDTDFTEKMDYFCALTLVLYNFFGMYCRFLGTDKWWKPASVGLLLLGIYAQHVYYLSFVKFDYGYNMTVNIFFGALVLSGWLCWCIVHRKQCPYVWKCAIVLVSMNLLLVLELGDFPPYLWTFDAHSLWHAGTAPLGILWYSFLIDDCLYMVSSENKTAGSAGETGSKKSV